jgi:hypothetical protein
MASWDEFVHAAPDLAAAIRSRFEADVHAVLATLRADGSPRVSGLEIRFRDGELWLAMMPDSRKADDFRRDPRFALHSAPDTTLNDGDATVNGSAREVTDPSQLARFVDSLDRPPPSSGVGLFRADISDASLTRVEGDFLVVDSWRVGEVARQRRRQ